MSCKNLLSEALEMQKEFIEVRRYLHAHAEVGFSLPHTVGIVCAKLREYGYTPKKCGASGICAEAGSGSPVFLLRADMDALRMSEESELDYAAENGNMHACGHDMHTSMLLCAAKLLKAHESELCGTVRLMFQPAEEILSGAEDMIAGGILRDPVPDAAMAIHVLPDVGIPSGSIVIPSGGESAPSADYFDIEVEGRACHGSTPQNGADALFSACSIVTALNAITSRELGMADRAVLTVGKMQAGSAANAIAGKAHLSGTFRTYGADTRDMIKRRIAEISEGVAHALGTSAGVRFGGGCPVLKNDGALCLALRGYCSEMLPPGAVCGTEALGGAAGGSEDFAYIAQKVPAAMLFVAAGANEYPLHHPRVCFDESAIAVGGAVYAHTALRWLSDRREGADCAER